jgi:hypothetical protein
MLSEPAATPRRYTLIQFESSHRSPNPAVETHTFVAARHCSIGEVGVSKT